MLNIMRCLIISISLCLCITAHAYDPADYEYLELSPYTGNPDATWKESALDGLFHRLDGTTTGVLNATSLFNSEDGFLYIDDSIKIRSDPGHVYGEFITTGNSFEFLTTSGKNISFSASGDCEIYTSGGSGTLKLQSRANGDATFFDAGVSGENPFLKQYGWIAAGSGLKYVQYQVSDTTDWFELTREDANLLGFDIQMPVNTTDDFYVNSVGLSDGTVGSSGAGLIGINAINGTTPNMQMFVDGTQSSQIYSGGVVSENAALNGTIDVTAITGYIKRSADNEAVDMGSFELDAVAGQALSSGVNWICVDYDGSPPVLLVTNNPALINYSTVFAFAIAYKDVNNHVHITQGISNYLGLPYKVNSRFQEHEGLVRSSGLVTSEATENLALDITAGVMWQGLTRVAVGAYDGDHIENITGAGTGGTVSANNTIVLDSLMGDETDDFPHGHETCLHNSSNGNDGCYHVETATWDGTNTTIVMEETSLNTGDDTGHLHERTFTYWNYTADNGWLETNQAGGHVAIHIDVAYWNDITKNQGSQFTNYVSNRYGTAFVYVAATDDARVHVVYGQGSYTLAQAEEVSVPSELPTIVSSLCVLVAKIIFQEGDTDFYEVEYPWTTVFSSSGAADHGNLAGLGDQADHIWALTLDGTRAMTGTLDMGTNAISNVTTLDANGLITAGSLSILSGGNVGIGTTSAETELNIKAESSDAIPTDATPDDEGFLLLDNDDDAGVFSGIGFRVRSTNSARSLFGLDWTSSKGEQFLRIRDDASSKEVMRWTTDGVGIGTDSPDEKLHIHQEAGNVALVVGSSGTQYGATLRLLTDDTTGTRDGWLFQALTSGDDNDFRIGEYIDDSFSEKFRIEHTTGNVGIGTASPEGNLEVVETSGDSRIYVTTYDTTASDFSILTLRTSKGGSVGSPVETIDGDFLGRVDFLGVDSASNFDIAGQITVKQNGASGAKVPGDMYLETYQAGGALNTNQLVLNTGGNVGIGTDEPGSILTIVPPSAASVTFLETALRTDVSSESKMIWTYGEGGASIGEIAYGRTSTVGQNYFDFNIWDGDEYVTAMRMIGKSGEGNDLNIGMGTTLPAENLEIKGVAASDNNVTLRLSAGNNEAGQKGDIEFWWTGAPHAKIRGSASGSDGQLDFYTRTADGSANLTSKMTIDDMGNVGIGTADPDYDLDVTGDIRATDDVFVNDALVVGGLATFTKAVGDTAPVHTESNLVLQDSTAIEADVGGSITFTGKYTGSSYLSGAPFIKGYKLNAVDGNYDFGLKFGTRENGQTLSTKMTIMGSGNVGIGTAAPTNILHIEVPTASTQGVRIKVKEEQSGADFKALIIDGEDNTGNKAGIYWSWQSIGDTASPAVDGIYESATEAGLAFSVTDADTRFELMRLVGATGNVGIGTASPSYKLEVTGDVNITDTLELTTAGTATTNASGEVTVTIGVTMPNTGYTVQLTPLDSTDNAYAGFSMPQVVYYDKTTTTFKIRALQWDTFGYSDWTGDVSWLVIDA